MIRIRMRDVAQSHFHSERLNSTFVYLLNITNTILNYVQQKKFQEEILRLRMLNDSKKEQSAAFQNPYSPPQLSQQQMPIKFIGIAIAMVIFGWILGKFLL